MNAGQVSGLSLVWGLKSSSAPGLLARSSSAEVEHCYPFRLLLLAPAFEVGLLSSLAESRLTSFFQLRTFCGPGDKLRESWRCGL